MHGSVYTETEVSVADPGGVLRVLNLFQILDPPLSVLVIMHNALILICDIQ